MAVHNGKDSQSSASARQLGLRPWPVGVQVAVAGGLTVEDVPWVRKIRPDARLIVGSAITAAADPGAAAAELYRAAQCPQDGVANE
jgi:3-hexulose-6-phosphate synthase